MTDRYARIREALAAGPIPGRREIGSEYGKFMTEVLVRSETGPAQVIALARTRKEVGVLSDEKRVVLSEGKRVVESPEGMAAAALIAACDPDTVRELLEERDALKAENDRLMSAINRCQGGSLIACCISF